MLKKLQKTQIYLLAGAGLCALQARVQAVDVAAFPLPLTVLGGTTLVALGTIVTGPDAKNFWSPAYVPSVVYTPCTPLPCLQCAEPASDKTSP